MSMFSKISAAVRQPYRVLSYIIDRGIGLYDLVSAYQRRLRSNKGVDIMEEDWDNLIILDACRYDTYQEKKNIPGRCKPVISKGSATVEFLRKNFTKQEYFDTVYVTANPHVDRHVEKRMYSTISPWKTHWDEKYHTVMPEIMTDITAETADMYPEKRLISHYMQPHRPFIGNQGKTIEDYESVDGHREIALGNEPDWVGENPYNLRKRGELSETTIRDAYGENLELVLDAVEKLSSKLEGKTVITADHGNLFSDRFPPLPESGFPHPPGMYLEDLVKVPWHVLPSEQRRTITSAPPQEATTNDIEEEVVHDRLGDLGYL